MNCKYCRKEIPAESVYCLYCGRKQDKETARKKRGNGQGTVYKRGNSYTGLITMYRSGKRFTRSKGGFKTKKEAYEWCAANEVFDTAKERYTVQQLYDLWSESHYKNIGDTKAKQYTSAFKNCAKIAPLYWDEVTLQLMQECVDNALNSHYMRKYVRAVLKGIEDYAIKIGYATKAITNYIEIPPLVAPRKEVFSDEDIEKLFKLYKSGDKDAAAPLIMIHTGMRIGEIRTILPENIHIKEGYMIGGIKTDAGRNGEILILPEIAPIIQDMMLPENTYSKTSDTIFRQHFNAALVKAGCEKHTTHECRHTFASLLTRKGIQPAIIKELMRHSDFQQTMTYVHIDRDTKKAALSHILE